MEEQKGETPQDEGAKPAKKKMSKGKIIAIIVVVVLVIGALGAGAGGGKSTSQSKSDSTSAEQTQQADKSSNDSSAKSDSSKTEAKTEDKKETSFADDLAKLGTFEATTVEGSGDDVIDVPCAGKPCLLTIHYSGAHNFVVKELDANGSDVDLLVNTIGAYDGTVTTYGNYSKTTSLQIKSSGSWTITFAPMSSMEKAENGSPFTGDYVAYIDEPKMSKVRFTNDGEHNFVVQGIGLNSSKLLVNEIGTYDGTVAWNQAKSFFIVKSSGTWTISW